MRLVKALQAIGIVLGGQAGARLAARLRLPTSASTLLRLVRAAPTPHTPALQAVGVDEWAWRRATAMAPSWSIWRRIASWTCCRTARPRR
jgi:hypothetical protein